jgi:hypothetical protein
MTRSVIAPRVPAININGNINTITEKGIKYQGS